MTVKLWVDDVRPEPDGWTRAQSADEAIAVLSSCTVEFASLDHDLGEFASAGGNGVAITDWMAEHNCWPRQGVTVHSSNPVGVRTMLATVDRYGPYRVSAGRTRAANSLRDFSL
jgi:hypothetical protein